MRLKRFLTRPTPLNCVWLLFSGQVYRWIYAAVVDAGLGSGAAISSSGSIPGVSGDTDWAPVKGSRTELGMEA